MNFIRRHRPTPATIIALSALVVALGGVAFATIPDSDGTVHACYQKRTGDLRVVESSQDCRSSRERPIDLGSPGAGASGGIVARIRSTGPVNVTANTVPIPLEGNTWTQGPSDTNELFIEATVSIPTGACPTSRILYYVDGQQLTQSAWGRGGDFGGTTRLQDFLLDPGATTDHTLTAVAETSGIGPTCGAVVDSIRINVDATR
jgi:hypothetical protein